MFHNRDAETVIHFVGVTQKFHDHGKHGHETGGDADTTR
jgi:hypothetical protein